MNSLAGHLLIAMPTLADPHFSRTVTFVFEHTDEGALGVTVNRPAAMTVGEVLSQLGLGDGGPAAADAPVFHGGPVHVERGFVLHDAAHAYASTLRAAPDIAVTTSRDVLEAVAARTAPSRILVALGCAGWAPGQLEQEMLDNSWLSVPASAEVLFDTPADRRWDAAARLLGIDVRLLSGDAGHA